MKLRIVPQLIDNWQFHDDRGFALRRKVKEWNEQRQAGERKRMVQTRVKLHRRPHGWTYVLEARYRRDDEFVEIPVEQGLVETGPDIRRKDLKDVGPIEQLNWDDLPVEALEEERAEQVKSIRPQFRKETFRGRSKNPEAMKALWKALVLPIGERDDDGWNEFDPFSLFLTLKIHPFRDPVINN